MSRKIKLIWDFRGPASAKTAEHHEIHLKEYIVVTDENMIQVRDALKPHRGEVFEG
jgi:hypothetical protein